MNYMFAQVRFKELIQLWSFTSPTRRKQVYAAILLSVISSLSEILVIAAVFSFLNALSNSSLQKLSLLPILLPNKYVENPSQLINVLALGLIAVIAATTAIRFCNLFVNGRVAAAIVTEIGSSAFNNVLSQPYNLYLRSNSSNFISIATLQLENIGLLLSQVMTAITSLFILIGIVIAIVSINASLTFLFIFFFVFSYLLLGFVSKQHLRRNGKLLETSSRNRILSLQEGVGAIRDVILDHNQHLYVSLYQKSDAVMRRAMSDNNFISVVPRYTLEALGFSAIALLAIVFSNNGIKNTALLPFIGTLAVCVQRLLPLIQQFYFAWAGYTSTLPALTAFLDFLTLPVEYGIPLSHDTPRQTLFDSITFDNVCFFYEDSSRPIIKNASFIVKKGERVGVVGATGCGKSTLLDLAMALLAPTNGRILINDLDVNGSRNIEAKLSWQKAIAHVPQDIFLVDSTILNNIAFGVPSDKVDRKRVIHAAKQAQLHDFIKNTPDGYNTRVGERGVILSGGQKQRLGLARALYKNASVLFLDEATSALDSNTELSVIEELEQLSSNITIFIVAHRFSTLRSCTHLINIQDGVVVMRSADNQQSQAQQN